MRPRSKENTERGTDINNKLIVLDNITASFLKNMRSIRKKLGLSLDFIANTLGFTRTLIMLAEKGMSTPSLLLLIKLAEILNTDISESINYKFFYRKIKSEKIKKTMLAYGLSYVELAEITGYNRKHVSLAVRLKPKATLSCLYAVLQAIHRERLAAAVRDTMTNTKGSAGRLATLETDSYI